MAVYMHLIYILLSNGSCVSDLNKIMPLPRNLEGGSMSGFDKSNNVECRCWGSLLNNSSS